MIQIEISALISIGDHVFDDLVAVGLDAECLGSVWAQILVETRRGVHGYHSMLQISFLILTMR